MGLAKGAVNDCISQTCAAILKLRCMVLKWSDAIKRKNISERIQFKHRFGNCVGLIDGTLFPLAFAPTLNGEDYFTRKNCYAFHGLNICNDNARITWIKLGWPGSVHDNRVWRNSDNFVSKDNFFDSRQYLLVDSAFLVSSVLVPAFKKGHSVQLEENKSYFNTKLAKIRIKPEHCIGLLKARFQRLRGHRRIIRSVHDLKSLLNLTMCCCILRNLLLEENIPQDWFELNDCPTLEEDDELNQPINSYNAEDRRAQLFAYLLRIRKVIFF